jgi:hypothetical protein
MQMKMRKLGLPVLAVVAVTVAMVAIGCGQQDAGPATLLEVDSTTFSHVGYDPAAQQLTVVFRESGDTYVYRGVGADVYQGLLAADSIGAYYHEHIRDRFQYDRR